MTICQFELELREMLFWNSSWKGAMDFYPDSILIPNRESLWSLMIAADSIPVNIYMGVVSFLHTQISHRLIKYFIQ